MTWKNWEKNSLPITKKKRGWEKRARSLRKRSPTRLRRR
jgi:hypothetical protein